MAAKKVVVLLLGLHENDAKEKRKVLKAVSTFPGLDMISIDMKERKLTVAGLVDPIELVTKLRKLWHADILFVGPASEENPGGWDKKEFGGGVNREGNNKHQEVTLTAEQVVGRPADMPSWPQPHAAEAVFPARHPSYPYHPHQHSYVAGGHGAQDNPHDSYYAAHGRGAREVINRPGSYAYHGHGARGNRPGLDHGYGARESNPNACAIC